MYDVPLTWTFAGFADGTIGIYDERVYANGGRVHQARHHKSWIISAHIKVDTLEVITGSSRGTINFWDIRTMRAYKVLEAQKVSLTAMAVHNCAPIIATGSSDRFIQISTLSGNLLGDVIKYREGFMGQRIGPITSLSFHPYKTLLAAGTSDNVVSIYCTVDH